MQPLHSFSLSSDEVQALPIVVLFNHLIWLKPKVLVCWHILEMILWNILRQRKITLLRWQTWLTNVRALGLSGEVSIYTS